LAVLAVGCLLWRQWQQLMPLGQQQLLPVPSACLLLLGQQLEQTQRLQKQRLTQPWGREL
jgi:hypothetical protein